MLNLARKIGESIMIGTSIKIRIIDIKGKQVKLGIEAPERVTVHREEVYQKFVDEQAPYLKKLF